MILVNINGGLGNQMFQYAFGKAESVRLKTRLGLDITPLLNDEGVTVRHFALDQLNISGRVIKSKDEYILDGASGFRSSLRNAFSGKKRFTSITEEQIKSGDAVVNENSYIYGYFQTETHLNPIRNEILNEFRYVKEIPAEVSAFEKMIAAAASSISLHVRRGDYVSNSHVNTIHGTCSQEYYNAAIQAIRESVSEELSFFIFSDDIEWCRREFSELKNATYIEYSFPVDEFLDIHLMKSCDHNIIANSSFSWWGAWLNENEDKKVIAPKRWFNDDSLDSSQIVPQNWIKL